MTQEELNLLRKLERQQKNQQAIKFKRLILKQTQVKN